MSRARPSWLAISLVVIAKAAAASSDGPALEVLSPRADEYLSGPVTMEAALELADDTLTRLLFFADGKLVCVVRTEPYQCGFDAGSSVVPHLIRVVAELENSPRLVRNVVTPGRVSGLSFRASASIVLVPTTVTHKGRYVTDLEAQDFRVFEDGVPHDVVSFAAEDAPIELVVAVDASSSMEEAMPQVIRAVESFLSRLAPDDRITLLAFNDEIYTLAGRDRSAEARLEALRGLAPFGNTSLYDAIARAQRLLESQSGKRAIVVFTDGQDMSSQITLQETEAIVESGSSTLFMIGLGTATSSEHAGEVLERLSERSGGRALFDERLDRLEAAFAEVYREIRSQYLLGFSPRNQEFTGEWRTLRVELDEEDYEARGREGYRARPR